MDDARSRARACLIWSAEVSRVSRREGCLERGLMTEFSSPSMVSPSSVEFEEEGGEEGSGGSGSFSAVAVAVTGASRDDEWEVKLRM